MSIEDRILEVMEDPERRARTIRWIWWISMAFLFLGYAYMAYVLFF